MKEYGADFQKKYDNIREQIENLNAKVRKRAKFLSSQELPFENRLKNRPIDEMSISALIDEICSIEERYISQSKQGNLFE